MDTVVHTFMCYRVYNWKIDCYKSWEHKIKVTAILIA